MAMSTNRADSQREVSNEPRSEAVEMSDLDPSYEYVASVTRDRDGKPAHTGSKFKVMVPEGASDDEIKAAWNADGEMPPADKLVRIKDWLRV